MNDIAVKMTDICFSYGNKKILEHFSLTLMEDSITVLMGPSGVGKTTILRILAGLEQPESGSLEGLTNKRVSIVFQEDRLCEELSALSNIRLVCRKDKTREEIRNALEKAGLINIENQPVRELSGGMRRRVALIRALLAPAELLLLDEPFQGLDEENKKRMISYVLGNIKGMAVLIVTHDEEEAAAMGGNRVTLAK